MGVAEKRLRFFFLCISSPSQFFAFNFSFSVKMESDPILFVPERGPVLRSWLSQEEEDRKQDSGSDSEMIALGYLGNIASRHAELVSKYCSQGFSNLQPRYFKTRS
ncbi:hypothetical protein RJ60_03960 [Mesotoga sp. B105.6.4]|nr:hypothetical protein RJ60_03960 [Mesotoga sp. B105.6.4]RAM59369.1 hypothetical protein DS67_05680 [Mesotoga sp. SC_4PWA21]